MLQILRLIAFLVLKKTSTVRKIEKYILGDAQCKQFLPFKKYLQLLFLHNLNFKHWAFIEVNDSVYYQTYNFYLF